MRNLTKTQNEEIKMETSIIENNHIENEINDFYETNNTDWNRNRTIIDYDDFDEVDEFIEMWEEQSLIGNVDFVEAN